MWGSRAKRSLPICALPCALLILLAVPVPALQSPGHPLEWRQYLRSAEKELENGSAGRALESYRAALSGYRNDRRRYSQGMLVTLDEMPRDLEAGISLTIASLLANNALASGDKALLREAQSAFKEANELARAYPALQFRVRNELVVFLLQSGRLKEAQELLEQMQAVAPEQDAIAISRYEFNFGQLLMQEADVESAYSHYFAAVKADPAFRPAADALFNAGLEMKSPIGGIEAVWALASRSLASLDAIAAAEYLRAGLEKKEWWREVRFSDLLESLLGLFIATDLDSAGFQADWASLLGAIVRDSSHESSLRAQTIIRAFNGELRSCVDSREILTKSLPWVTPEDKRLFSTFLTTLGDQQFKLGKTGAALDYYLAAVCLDQTTEKANLHLASLLREAAEIKSVLEARSVPPEVYAAIAAGYSALHDPLSAAGAFLRAAQVSSSSPDVEAYMARAIELSPDQRALLLQTQEELIAELERTGGQITVTGQPVFVNRVAVAALTGIPNSRGSLSLASLVAPNAFASHLNLTDSEGGQAGVRSLSFAGANSRQNTLSVDNVVVEGPPGPESPSAYYELDDLEGVDVMGGGADASLGTNGLHINLVTKTPDNQWSGSGNYLLSPHFLQAEPVDSRIALAPGQAAAATDRLRGNREYNAQLGGPLLGDRFVAWASYGGSYVEARALGGTLFRSHVSDASAKLAARLTKSQVFSAFFNRDDHSDRGFGAGLVRAPETTLNRHGQGTTWRLDYECTSSAYDLAAQYSQNRGDFSQRPQSAPGGQMMLGSAGMWKGSFRSDLVQSMARQWQLAGTYSPAGLRNLSLFRAGGSHREVDAVSEASFGSSNSMFIDRNNFDRQFDIARFFRSGRVSAASTQSGLWLQGTLKSRVLTLDLGLRRDQQQAGNQEASAGANPLLPDLLPEIHVSGGNGGILWRSLLPRVGITYSLGHTALLRGSYAEFASPLQFDYIQRTNAATPGYLQFGFDDSNGNGVLDPSERESAFLIGSSGLDPEHLDVGIANSNAPGLEPENTREITLGFETGAPDQKLELAATWRRVSRVLELRSFVRDDGGIRPATREDFVRYGTVMVTLPDGRRSSAEVFTLAPHLSYTGGTLLTNGDREQEYFGLHLSFGSHLGGRGKLRGVLAYEQSRWTIGPRFRFFDDPTNSVDSLDPSGHARADDSGGPVASQPAKSGSSGSPFAGSKWSANINGTFELPLGILLGTNINCRQGYALPYFASVLPPDGREREVQTTGSGDSFRLPDLYVVDLRLQRSFSVQRVFATVGLESFNLLNVVTSLQRVQQLNGPQANYLAKTVSPRTVRVGIRLAWGHG